MTRRTLCWFVCLPSKLSYAAAFCKVPKEILYNTEICTGYFYKFAKEVKHVVSLDKKKPAFLRRQVTLFEAARSIITGALEYNEHKNHISAFWLSRPRKQCLEHKFPDGTYMQSSLAGLFLKLWC